MKKSSLLSSILVMACLALSFMGCQKETSYQIINDMTYYQSTVAYLDGTIYEVVVFQMKGNEIIKQDNIDKIRYGGGKSSVIKAENGCEKVKVSYKLLPKESPLYDLPENARSYTVVSFPIAKGKTTQVIINDDTMVSTSMKSMEKSSEQGTTILNTLQIIDNK